MLVEGLVPRQGEVPLAVVMADLDSGPPPCEPFAESTVGFLSAVGARLAARSAALSPDLHALAFWLRPAHLHELKGQFEKSRPATTISLPRGLVVHLPPSNVDTIFMYS